MPEKRTAEERASWDERDAMTEQCREAARASGLRAGGAAAGGSEATAKSGDAPDPSGGGGLRTVGRRSQPPAGVLRAPTPEEQDWVRHMSVYRTRVPKGVFRYASAEEANADWDRWRAALLTEVSGSDRSGERR